MCEITMQYMKTVELQHSYNHAYHSAKKLRNSFLVFYYNF